MAKFKEIADIILQYQFTYELCHLKNVECFFRNLDFSCNDAIIAHCDEKNNDTRIVAITSQDVSNDTSRVKLFIHLFSMPLLYGGRYETRCEISFLYDNNIYTIYGLHGVYNDIVHLTIPVSVIKTPLNEDEYDNLLSIVPLTPTPNSEYYSFDIELDANDKCSNIISETIEKTRVHKLTRSGNSVH